MYDGDVDSEGTYWPPGNRPNALTYLPVALREYPKCAASGDERAHAAMLRAGFVPGSEFLWDFNYRILWDGTQRRYREEVGPGFDGDLDAGIPYCQSGTPNCDADYDYDTRPKSVHDAVRRASHSGRIGKPLITVQGTLDTLLPIKVHGNAYADAVCKQGRGALHRYYRIEDASPTACGPCSRACGRRSRRSSAGRPTTAGSRRAAPPSPAPPPVTWSTPAPSAARSLMSRRTTRADGEGLLSWRWVRHRRRGGMPHPRVVNARGLSSHNPLCRASVRDRAIELARAGFRSPGPATARWRFSRRRGFLDHGPVPPVNDGAVIRDAR
ncbi:hypothetical protein [Nonomuraea sp. NPDC049625]|uniref:hypothetical protein n=1 Tax=Nonomuraea sp. NPDC049625 TaxID=3155775 RepID=UPI0034225210